MEVSSLLSEMDGMILQGQIVEAVDKFFAPTAKTVDFDGTITNTKSEMLNKMNDFVGSIQAVNGINLHYSTHTGNVSMSEYTFDFTMIDGSLFLWHEIIRRVWQDGQVIDEQYFKN